MTIEETKAAILSWDEMLPPKMKNRIHYRSMRNFVSHFDEITNRNRQIEILNTLNNYVEEVQANDYSFDYRESIRLATTYMFPIVPYYREYANFVAVLQVHVIWYVGFVVDAGLYCLGLLSKIFYLPIATICLTVSYILIELFRGRYGRVYGTGY